MFVKLKENVFVSAVTVVCIPEADPDMSIEVGVYKKGISKQLVLRIIKRYRVVMQSENYNTRKK